MQYGFNVFNLFNTMSMDVPQNNTQIAQGGACGNNYLAGGSATNGDCTGGYEKYGMVVTDQGDQAGTTVGPAGSGSAGSNLYELPYTNGTSGKNTVVPTTIPLTPIPTHGCTVATEVSSAGCANNGATFGAVTTNIGSNRMITMDLHIVF